MERQQQSWEQSDEVLISAGPCPVVQASAVGNISWLNQSVDGEESHPAHSFDYSADSQADL